MEEPKFLEIREEEINIRGRKFVMKTLSGKSFFKFMKNVDIIQKAKEDNRNYDDDVADAYYNLFKIALNDVEDVWLDANLTTDVSSMIISKQLDLNSVPGEETKN